MWIVLTALRRPYTFVVLAVLIALFGLRAALTTPTDIFPNINIPVIAVAFNYTGMPPDEMEKRVVGQFERILTTTVNDIEHIESQSLSGVGVVKVYFQKNAKIEEATAQVTAIVSADEIRRLFDPAAYQGVSQQLIDRLIATARPKT